MVLTGLTLGVALAMDAFCVSLADSMAAPDMGRKRMVLTALVFGLFQTAMPLLGRFLILTVANTMTAVRPYIGYVAAAVFALLALGMLREALGNGEEGTAATGLAALLIQGLATSIDALSAGFEFYSEALMQSVIISLIIGLVTFLLCMVALAAGRFAGVRLQRYARLAGSAIFLFLCIKHIAGF